MSIHDSYIIRKARKHKDSNSTRVKAFALGFLAHAFTETQNHYIIYDRCFRMTLPGQGAGSRPADGMNVFCGEVFVAKEKKKYWFIIGILLCTVYAFIAAQPIPVETVLAPRWLSSLETSYSAVIQNDAGGDGYFLPFLLGERFGYIDAQGNYIINQIKKGYVSLSGDRWAEYEALSDTIEVRSPRNETILTIPDSRGYPLFLDNKIFIIHDEQNALSLVDDTGRPRWTCDFAAPLTSIDAAADLILIGSLDGAVELLDSRGQRVFFFEPGGSRLSVILGCRISKDGSRLAIVSGIDDQRFLLLERFGDSYKVVYHEFLEDGFRRAIHMAFIDNDNRIAFEREGGLGIYEINSRRSIKLSLRGSISAIEESGSGELFFIISSQGGDRKNLVAIRLPGSVIMEAPFKSKEVLLSRYGSELYIGGDTTLASFMLDKR
ncbi:MAG: PQQ-like beta-propeller repeat protein [Treponema sp.]|jgi:hypothetical protein|nr:PQQ-like beta-propeller repeat protein [Treponema sp.]